jgi:hypothetical protein
VIRAIANRIKPLAYFAGLARMVHWQKTIKCSYFSIGREAQTPDAPRRFIPR